MVKKILVFFLGAAMIAAAAWHIQTNRGGKEGDPPPSYSEQLGGDGVLPSEPEDKPSGEPAAIAAETSGKPAQILTAKVKYDCDGGKVIRAEFYKGEKIGTVPGQPPMLTDSVGLALSDGRDLELMQTISADGGRYANSEESVVFWDKGDTVLVLENGVEKNYVNCKINDSSQKNATEAADPNSAAAKVTTGNEYRGYFEKEKYYYPIGNGAEIDFVFNNPGGKGAASWNGDVFLKKNGKSFVLLKSVEIAGPGAEDCVVWSTNDPNILLLRRRDGDLGWWVWQDYYLDLAKNKIVLTVSNDVSYALSAQKENLPTINLGLLIAGECGEIGQRAGKKVQITDLTLNGKPANVLGKPIEFGCDDEAMLGPGYDIAIDFEQTAVESDFSKFYFVLKGRKWDNKNNFERELWKKEFYIPLENSDNLKIYPEN